MSWILAGYWRYQRSNRRSVSERFDLFFVCTRIMGKRPGVGCLSRKVEVLILGKEVEDGAFPPENSVNESYDICVRLWFEPQKQSDGSMMWHDKNTKIIYFQKDCIYLDVEWVDNNIVRVNENEIRFF